eukprot:SM000183S04006  [mRNA]  locus=s183:280176:283150:- [translate_table: standard]
MAAAAAAPAVAVAVAGGGGGSGGGGGPDLDVTVFRFTLGIPGFDDADLPRAVGVLLGALLAANHVASAGAVAPAQWRSEVLGLLLAGLAVATPYLGRRLKRAQGGREALAAQGSNQSFLLAASLSDAERQELAWATYAILRNTTTSGVLVWRGGKILCARGSWDVGGAEPGVALEELAGRVQKASADSPELKGLAVGETASLYVPLRSGDDFLPLVPSSAASLFAHSWGLQGSSLQSSIDAQLHEVGNMAPISRDVGGLLVLLTFSITAALARPLHKNVMDNVIGESGAAHAPSKHHNDITQQVV